MRSVLPPGRTLRGWWLARVAASLIYRKACGDSVRPWGSCNDDASRVRLSAGLSCGKARAPKFCLQVTRFGVAGNLSCVISRFWRTFMTRRRSPNGFHPPLSCAFSDRYLRSRGVTCGFSSRLTAGESLKPHLRAVFERFAAPWCVPLTLSCGKARCGGDAAGS